MAKKGSILIFTLWVMAILTIFTIAVSYRASGDIRLAKYESYKIKAAYLAKAGTMKMLTELSMDKNAYDSLNEDWNRAETNPKEFKIAGDTVFYGAGDENRRLNLNSSGLTKPNLTALGIDEDTAEKILKYKETKDSRGFEFMEELFLIDGMTREIYSKFESFATIYRGAEPRVNINTAPETVLFAVLQDSALVNQILGYRKGPDAEEGTDDDGIFENTTNISVIIPGANPALFTVTSGIFRIWAYSVFSGDEKTVKGARAVMDKAGKIYYWKEY